MDKRIYANLYIDGTYFKKLQIGQLQPTVQIAVNPIKTMRTAPELPESTYAPKRLTFVLQGVDFETNTAIEYRYELEI